MALHKKHRLVIALGNNNDVYGIFCFHLEEMLSALGQTGL